MQVLAKEDLKKGSADPNVQDVNRDSFIIFLGEELEKATCGIDRNDPNQEAFELLPQEKIDAINRLIKAVGVKSFELVETDADERPVMERKSSAKLE